MSEPLDQLAARGREGDRAALEALVRAVQDRLYRLSLRMLGDVDEARDATQEIVLKVVTRLSTFRGDSAFVTWALKVATHHLLNLKAGRREQLSFDHFGELLEQGLEWNRANPDASPLDAVVVEEGKLLCTQAWLSCLDREHRLAFVLGEILELPGDQAAEVLDIEPAAFRKRLSRAREQVESFAQRRCGLVAPANACRCATQARFGVQAGIIDPRRLAFARHPAAPAAAELERVRDAAELLRSHPKYSAPDQFVAAVRGLVDDLP